MKCKNYVLLIFVLLASMLFTTTVSAKATRIEFTMIETCNEDLDWAKAWEAGANLQIAGLTQTCIENGSIPQAQGIAYLYDGRAHLIDGQAVMTGGSRIETTEGGVWDGRWTFQAGVFNYVAHGEGIYAGQHYFSTSNHNGNVKGYILIPGN
jgi:hypothetical protein